MMGRRSIRAWLLAVLAVLVCAGLTSSLTAGPTTATTVGSAAAAKRSKAPNIVLILMDDFSMELLPTMPAAHRLAKRSAVFTHAYVADSLCCTSRAVLFTGQYPHNTKVRSNKAGNDPRHPVGGWQAFRRYGDQAKSFNVSLNRSPRDYWTGFYGKYLNQYHVARERTAPPGWSSWHAIGDGGYRQWHYKMTTSSNRHGERVLGRLRYGNRDRDYATSVMARNAASAIRHRRAAGRPYFLEVSTYGTHQRNGPGAHKRDPRFPPAFRDRPRKKRPQGNCGRIRCKRLDVRDLPGWNDGTKDNAPRFTNGRRAHRWQANRPPRKATTRRLNTHLRNRARMAQSIDRLVARVVRLTGPDTYIFLTSDNGYHLGQHRLPAGKGTAYGHDTQVPLIVHGPGVKPGRRGQVVSNVDLASTFEDIAGARSAVVRDGRSMLPVLRARHKRGQRYTFIEHRRPGPNRSGDPDAEGGIRRIPSYIAVRSRDALLVRYNTGRGHTYEFYRGLARAGGYERKNTYHRSNRRVRAMTRRLEMFDGCTGSRCRAAAR